MLHDPHEGSRVFVGSLIHGVVKVRDSGRLIFDVGQAGKTLQRSGRIEVKGARNGNFKVP